MPMPAGNFIIIAISLLVVLTGGLWVFFWWRGRYGVWAREREARGRDTRNENVTVIGGDSGGWYGTGAAMGAMGAMATSQARGQTDAAHPDTGPSEDLYRSGGSSSEPGLGEGGNFDSPSSSSSGSDSSSSNDSGGSSDSGGGGGDSGGGGD